jgi:exodeoxyribonuclease VII large subunit
VRRIVDIGSQRLDHASRRLLTPAQRIARDRERVAELGRRLRRAVADAGAGHRELVRLSERLGGGLTRALRERERRVVALRTALSHLDPTRVLQRGYSIVRDATGHVRTTSAGLACGDALDITFSAGGAGVKVEKPR